MFVSARLILALVLLCAAFPAQAEEFKPDDLVAFDLSAESWVTTTSARVTVNVDAAVAGSAAGGMRADMQKAVNDIAKGEWRLIGFSRGQDQTGLERWNASFEARLPEAQLGGLHDSAKKASKAGMQLTVADIAFDPTLAETETAKAKLRTDLYKQIGEQLAALNAAFPARQYRVGSIDFGGGNGNGGFVPPMAQRVMTMKAMAGAAAEDMASSPSMERAQKLVQTARVSYAAVAPVK